MSNEIANQILEKLTNIETSSLIIQNATLYFLGGIIGVGVCYLLYKAVSNFISF